MTDVKISIIVPVYNTEKYLGKCLESLVGQTFSDIEIICVNDGSTDNSISILNEYAQKDSRVVILDRQNEGVSVARNAGLDVAKGEYVMFVDSDDFIDLTTCEKVYSKIVKDNADMSVFGVNNLNNKGVSRATYLDNLEDENGFYFNDCPEDFYYVLTSAGAKLYKNDGQRFDVSLKKGEDTLFFWQYCLKNPKISILKEPLYNYCDFRQSATDNPDHINNGEIFKTVDVLRNSDAFLSAPKSVRIRILDRFAMSIFVELYIMRTRGFKIRREYLSKLKEFQSLFNEFEKSEISGLRYLKKINKNLIRYKRENLFSIINCGNNKILSIFGHKIRFNRYGFNKPVDIVYLWCDGNDIEWQKEKIFWQNKLGQPETDAINPCRFVDNEELRYSLRSVAKNAQWVNHIYIVTNGQVPKWLDTAHPKITVINHRDILPSDALPTFNAYSIETALANIPVLSEYFIYSNDDFFVYGKVSPDYFFDTAGKPILRFIKQTKDENRLKSEFYIRNVVYCANLIKEKFGIYCDYETTHNMDSYRKSYFLECREIFREKFEKTLYTKFTEDKLIQRSIVNFYMAIKKKCKFRLVKMNSRKSSRENLYIALSNPQVMNEKLLKYGKKCKLFCINDNEETLEQDRLMLKDYLESLFPNKQCWEKD